jgi:hypothetical protein
MNALELEAARFVLDLSDLRNLPHLAAEALAAGIESKALFRLAIADSDATDEIRREFISALTELGIASPSPEQAVRNLARDTAAEIVRGRIAPYDGAKRIWRFTLHLNRTVPELGPFIYAASEWEDRHMDRKMFDQEILRAARDLLDDTAPDI